MSDDVQAASSAAPTTAVTESQPAVSTPAPVSEAPALETPAAAAAPVEPGPVPYGRFKEVNDQLRELRAFREKYGWAERVSGDEFQQIAKWADAYRTDPIRWYADTTAELRQLYPHLVPNLTSEAARILRNGGRGLDAEPDIEPAIPVMNEQGQVVDRAYSAAQVKELVQRAVAEVIGKEVQPIKQTFQQQKAEALARQEQAQADRYAAAAFQRYKTTLPMFEEHKDEISSAYAQIPAVDEAGIPISAADAVLMAWAKVVAPKLDQKAQAKVLNHLQTQAAGASVHPSGTQGTPLPKFKNFKEAAEYFEKHPEHAEAMAQR